MKAYFKNPNYHYMILGVFQLKEARGKDEGEGAGGANSDDWRESLALCSE